MHKAQAAACQVFPQTTKSRPNCAKKCATNKTMAMYNVASLQRAARCDFFVKSLLHFSKFLLNLNFDLETNYIFRNPTNRHSKDILAKRKSYQIFSHEPNTFLCQWRNGKSHTNKATSKTPKPPIPLGACAPPSNTSIPPLTPLTTQTASRSNQPFCHSTPSGQTNRETDWQMG